MKSLNEIGVECKTDKSTITHCYLDNYEKHLGSWRDRGFTLLEIGVAAGNSIRMWREYFPKAKVYGVDNNPDCAGEGIFIGDQKDMGFWANVLTGIGGADIIIDDGSHVGHDMMNSFKMLFRSVKSGGYYVVEDTACLYNEHYNQGSKAFEFFTGLVRDVDVAGRAMTGNQDYAINHSMTEPPVPEYSRYLKAIHFYHSLYMFERK
jgi:8-demethyl-8-alpha-L-rhamnosyltetracenomycin-C 2'-O-methyltransferase